VLLILIIMLGSLKDMMPKLSEQDGRRRKVDLLLPQNPQKTCVVNFE
jgi:hypothetical protein